MILTFIFMFMTYTIPTISANRMLFQNEVITENNWDRMFCPSHYTEEHDEEVWFAELCHSFSMNPQTTIESVLNEARGITSATENKELNKEFLNFLHGVMKKCRSIEDKFKIPYLNYWFTKKPIFLIITPDLSLRFPNIFPKELNVIETTQHTKENFSIKTLFDLFLYLGIDIPQTVQNYYRRIYPADEPILYTNDPYILFNRYKEYALIRLLKTRAYISIDPQDIIITKNRNLFIKNKNTIRECLSFIFTHNDREKDVTFFETIINEYRVYENIKNDPIDKNLPSLEITPIPFNSLSKKMRRICAFLRIFIPRTKFDTLLRSYQYGPFVMALNSNPYWDPTILQQLNHKDILLLFESLQHIQECLSNTKHTNQVKQFIKNLVQRLIDLQLEGEGICNTNLFFKQYFFIINNNIPIHGLYENKPQHKKWLEKIRDSKNNTLLHYALRQGAENHIIKNLLKEFPEFVKEKNNKHELPFGIYQQRQQRNDQDQNQGNSPEFLETASDSIYRDFEELDPETLAKLQGDREDF